MPNPKRNHVLLGDFKGLQTANLELCSIKSLLTDHLAPDDWNSLDAFLFSLKTFWSTYMAVLYFKNCPEKIAQDSSSPLSVILMGNRNQTELYLQPSRSLIERSSLESIQHALSQGGFFTNLHHCSFLCKKLQENIWTCRSCAKLEEEMYVWQGQNESKGAEGYFVSLVVASLFETSVSIYMLFFFSTYSYLSLGSFFSSRVPKYKIVSLHPLGLFLDLGFSSLPSNKKAVNLVTGSPKSHRSVQRKSLYYKEEVLSAPFEICGTHLKCWLVKSLLFL